MAETFLERNFVGKKNILKLSSCYSRWDGVKARHDWRKRKGKCKDRV